MFYWIYELNTVALFFLIMAVFLIVAIAGLLLVRPYVNRNTDNVDANNNLVSFYLSGIGVFLGITIGLVAVGTWENMSDVEDKVSLEAAGLAALYRNVKNYPAPLNEELKEGLRVYTTYTIEVAWPLQRKGIIPTKGTEIVTVFQDKLYAFSPANPKEEILHREALEQFNRVIELRRLRLDSVTQGLPAVLWWVLILGAFLNIVLCWFFYVEDLRLHILLSGIMAIVLGSLIFLIAVMDYPFRGQIAVEPDSFILIYENLMK